MTERSSRLERGLAPFRAPSWDLGRLILPPPGRPLVMGIVNLTPDSFHPASRSDIPAQALVLVRRLIAEGADLIDLGAESSRPGAEPISTSTEQDRLLPVLEALRRESDIPVTVDTVRAATARAALAAGADAINDISAGLADPEMLPLVAARGCGLVLMHMQGSPQTMQTDPQYVDVVAEVGGWLAERRLTAVAAGVAPSRLVLDPGIGFGKNLTHNLALLAGMEQLADGTGLLLGASRKSFIGRLTGAEVGERLPGSLATLAAAWQNGVSIVRVHDVAASVQFLQVLQAISENGAAL